MTGVIQCDQLAFTTFEIETKCYHKAEGEVSSLHVPRETGGGQASFTGRGHLWISRFVLGLTTAPHLRAMHLLVWLSKPNTHVL